MNRIPKCSSKYYIHQPNNIKPAPKEPNKENLAQKISKKTLKFSSNRQFGKDITNNNKPNINSIYNNHCTKIVKIIDKKQNTNNIYIKKHSSASQVNQKAQKIKIFSGERKLRENKSNSMINKKNETTTSESYYNKNNNNTKKENPIQTNQGNYRLSSSISFGMNGNNRPISSNNSISVRLSNPKNGNYTNKLYGNINNRSINNIHNSTLSNNYNYSSIINNNTKNENNNHVHTQATLDLM
jgi:hypothetical protein